MPARAFHRLASPTQTAADAARQRKSGELWGRAPRGSLLPAVQAYCGPLPPHAEGIEFTCAIEPDAGSPPGQACWRAHAGRAPGEVALEGDFVRIAVKITKVRYRT